MNSRILAQLLEVLPRRDRKTGGGINALAAFFHSHRREQAPGEIRKKQTLADRRARRGFPCRRARSFSGGAR